MKQMTVHDPRGYPPKVVGKRLAPRLPTLDGKTIYLVDCLFDNTDVFMEQLRQWSVGLQVLQRPTPRMAA